MMGGTMEASDTSDPWDLVLSSPIRHIFVDITGPEEFVSAFIERLKEVPGVGFTVPAEYRSRRKLQKKLPSNDVKVRVTVAVRYDS
jgi:hypothetical protein